MVAHDMPEQWIIRVEGREYGPADFLMLLEWKLEGRVLPENDARRADLNSWIPASQIPGLFETIAAEEPPPLPVPARADTTESSFAQILVETIRIYFRGFPGFIGLALLVIIPSLCSQFTRTFIASFTNLKPDEREMVAAGVNVCMLVLFLVLWPIYIAGIQLLTRELFAGRRLGFFALLNEAVKYWPRVAVLCLFVYGTYFLLTVMLLSVLLTVVVAGPSALGFVVLLVALSLWVWIIGRLWVNFLFWQQFTVLEAADPATALRESKALARSRAQVSWFKRPLWRAVFIVSLWFLFRAATELPSVLPATRMFLQQTGTIQDPKALVEALQAGANSLGMRPLDIALWIVQHLLEPTVGIAFVLLYLDTRWHEGHRG